MSEMRRYKGSLEEIPNIELFCDIHPDLGELDPEWGSWEEALESEDFPNFKYKKIIKLDGKWYEICDLKDVYYDEDIMVIEKQGDNYTFDCQFYDGGCCLGEALEMSFRSFKKKEERSKPKVESKYRAELPTEFGNLVVYSLADHQSRDHLILRSTLPQRPDVPLIRMHSECLTGDVFHSERCDCKNQLHRAIERVIDEGGIIFYLRQEGRGIGLESKIGAYQLQQTEGLDTQEANHQLGLPDDCRDYKLVGQWLKEKGYNKVRLMSNNPLKIKALEDEGIEVIREEHLVLFSEEHAGDYLRTKKTKHGHILNLEEKRNGY